MATVTAPPARAARKRITGRQVAPYLFVLPNMLIFATFTIWPAINGLYLSFFDSRDGLTFKQVGTANYTQILTDDDFWAVARNTVVFTIAFVALSLVLGTALALALNAIKRGRGAISAAYFLPVLISPVVVGVIWRSALDPKSGLVNLVLGKAGIPQPQWLVEPTPSMMAIIIVGTWIHLGFYAMVLLSGLQSIDSSIYEAARIDGASEWQQVAKITLPLLQPTVMVVLILATIAGFQSFDFIYTLTGGGPVGATTLIVQYIYDRAFSYPIQYGLASAAAVILFVAVFIVTFGNYLMGRRSEAI